MEQEYVNQVDSERRRALRKKRHREAVIRRIIAIFSLVIIIGGIVTTVFLMKGRTPSIYGTYERKIDITQQIVGSMAQWLSDIDDMDIDNDYVAERVNSYYITETLSLAKDETGANIYIRKIDEASYNEIVQGVNADLDKLLTEIISQKLISKGYADNVTNDEAAQITSQVLGMSAGEYLAANGVCVAPYYENISKSLIGTATSQSGTYNLKKNVITISLNGEEKTETILFENGVLVFSESGRVYYAK